MIPLLLMMGTWKLSTSFREGMTTILLVGDQELGANIDFPDCLILVRENLSCELVRVIFVSFDEFDN